MFTFDYSYNSFVPRDDSEYASQNTVWNDIGVSVLDNAYQGALFSALWTVGGRGLGGGDGRGVSVLSEGTVDPRLTEHPFCILLLPHTHPAGYNCSLFAYGQTGSGKSYSMMG
jgi:hypothetical protein